MKKLKNKCLGGVAVMTLLACTNLVQASITVPQVTFHQQQVASSKVNVNLGMQGLGNEVIALEMSVIADDIKEVLSATSQIDNSYMTYQLTSLPNGQEKLTCYIVSKDKETPLNITQGKLSPVNFSLQTSGKLTVNSDNVSIKVIEMGYTTQNYTNQEMIYTEGNYNGSTSGSGSGSTNSGNSGSNNNNNSGNATNDNNQTSENQTISFTDLENHWAKSAIMNMASKGIIKGYADGTFRPSASITRGEFATLLARAFELEKVSTVNPFKDVLADKWYTDGIVALYHAGITSGRGDGNFGVNDPITNEEISAMLYRTMTVLNMNLDEINSAGITFTDENKISNYAKEAVQSLVKKGIISGKPDGSFGPKASTSRAQVAVMLDRIFTLKK